VTTREGWTTWNEGGCGPTILGGGRKGEEEKASSVCFGGGMGGACGDLRKNGMRGLGGGRGLLSGFLDLKGGGGKRKSWCQKKEEQAYCLFSCEGGTNPPIPTAFSFEKEKGKVGRRPRLLAGKRPRLVFCHHEDNGVYVEGVGVRGREAVGVGVRGGEKRDAVCDWGKKSQVMGKKGVGVICCDGEGAGKRLLFWSRMGGTVIWATEVRSWGRMVPLRPQWWGKNEGGNVFGEGREWESLFMLMGINRAT